MGMKILGSDFDGTLTVGGIGETKCALIRRWREAGNLFGIVSGRGTGYFRELRERYPDLEMDFFAAYNGAVILDGKGTVADATLCTEVAAAELTAFLHGAGCPFVFVNLSDGAGGEKNFTVRRDGEPLREGECRLAALPDGLTAFYQISVQLETPAEAAAVTARVKTAFGSRLNPLQNNFCIDVVASAVNKAFGLRRVAALFGGVEEEIIAVGDNVNDLDMLRAFPSYAMENGVEEAKAVAKNTIASVDKLILRELNV